METNSASVLAFAELIRDKNEELRAFHARLNSLPDEERKSIARNRDRTVVEIVNGRENPHL